MQFSDIPGLAELKAQLIGAHEKKKIAHAQLFSGGAGTATFPMAFAYATYLMCQNKTESDACGTCPNCTRMEKVIHPDVHWYFPKVSASDGGKYEKVVAEALPLWRTFISQTPYGAFDDWAVHYDQENKNLQLSREDSRQILKNVSMRSVEGGYKIIFIWGAESMHPTGANAILKILEEPPEHTIFILVAFNYDALLQTITSRTQLIHVPPNQPQEIEAYLVSQRVDQDQASLLARLSQGRIGSAMRLLQSDEDMAYNLFRDWMLACWNRDFAMLVSASEDFSKTGKANQRKFLAYSLSLIRNSVIKVAGNQVPIMSADEDKFITSYAERLGGDKLQAMYELINGTLQQLERNSNPRISHLNLSLAISKKINS